MDTKQYKIRIAFMFPLGLSLLFGSMLLILCIFQKEPAAKLVILSIVNAFLAIFFVESFFRCIFIDDSTIIHKKFLRTKILSWQDINSFESLSLRGRVFSTLSSKESFLIFTNAYENYDDLMKEILARLPQEYVSQETKQLAAAPPIKRSDIVSFWITAVILGGILFQQASAYIK